MPKHKRELMPEERLAAALVPEEEQPYELPDGWKWVHLGGILDVSKKKMEEFTPDTKYVGLENIEKDTGVIRAVNADGIKSTKNVFEAGDILYGKLRPYLNKHGVVEFSGVCSTDILVFKTSPLMENKLINHYFDLPQVISFAVSHSKGINLPRVNAKDILNICVPLPPLSEQQRLVARIESLFTKLDAAKAKVQAVLDAHETRKAALLDEAFRGKLTETLDETSTAEDFLDEIYAVKAQLVKEKKIKKPKRLPSMTDEEKPFEIPNTWRWVRFGDILRIINGDRGKNYPSKKELHEAGDIPFISALNIQDNTIATEHLLYVDEERYNLLRSGKLKKGDLVLCIRGSLGKNGRYPFDRGAIASSLVIIRSYLDNDAMYDYISFYLDSLLFKNEMSKYDNGTAQPNLGAGDLSLFAVPLPPLAEQHEIVAVLDRLLGREEEVRQSAESVLAAIDSMKQSILARAFRGELGA